MSLTLSIYKRALGVLAKKPFRLWGLSLLNGLLGCVAGVLFSVPLGLGICITMLLNTSMLMVFLHGYRGEEVNAKQLFECFRSWESVKRICGGLGWRALWIFLWALIPVVGPVFALIRTFEYWLTPYILLYEPGIALTDAIEESKKRTQGYKGKMFLAMILAPVIVAAAMLVIVLIGKISGLVDLFTLVLCLFTLLVGLLYPLFYGLVCAAFYEEISGNAESKE